MQGVIRVGDVTDQGCKVITGRNQSLVLGRAVARVGDLCQCGSNPGTCVIEQGDARVSLEGRAVAFDGHQTSCKATLVSSCHLSGMTSTGG